MPRKRLLFVDDEPQVLTLLQSMFRRLSPGWDSMVTDRGAEALALMAQQPFDMVVSDMQMPEMTGAGLLEQVRDLYPRTIRVVLSGYPDQPLSIQALGAAHQYLAKPFRVADLQAIVERADRLEQRVPDPLLREGLSRLSALSVVPAIWQRFERELTSRTVSVESLGGLMAQDPALTLKVLQAVHSAFFGAPSNTLLAKEAAQRLGGSVLRSITAAHQLVAVPVDPHPAGLLLDRLAKHSVATGLQATRILAAEGASPDAVKLGFTGGVLHDIGQNALALAAPEAYREVVRRTKAGEATLLEAEQAVLGTDHASAGAFLLGLWGLPQPLVDLVACHHQPAMGGTGKITPLTAVHVANHFQRESSVWQQGTTGQLDEQYLRTIRVNAERLTHWQRLGTEAEEPDETGDRDGYRGSGN
jgi:HD-like signal output (HDOD) protein